MSSCSTQMEDESTASSETPRTRESSNDQVVNGKMQVDEQCQACDDVKSEIPDGGCKLVLDSNSPPNQPIGNDNLLSREQLPPLPLVGDLFALNLVDDIVSRALEIVKEKEEIQLVKEKQQQNEEIRVEKCEQDVDVIAQKESASLEDKIVDIPTNLSPGNEISENNLSHEKDNAPLDFYLPEDDDSEDSELQELMGNSRNSISPTQSGFRPLDEEDTDDAIDLSKADDSTTPERVSPNSDESPQIYPNRSQVGSQPVNWLDCNGFPETNSESPQERELVTEIVFISETSFMDENRPSTHNGYCDDEEQGEMGEGRLDDVGQSYQVGNEGEVYPGQDEDDVIQSDLVLGSSGVLDFQVQENEESGNDQRQRNVEIQQVQDLENSRIQNVDFGEMNRGFQLDENDEIENVQFVKGTEIQDDQFSKMIEIQGDQFSEKIGIQGDQSLENNKIQDIEPFEKNKIQDIESFEENKIQDVQPIGKKKIQDIEPFEKCKIQDIAPFEKNKIQDAQSIEKNENQDVTSSVNNNPRAIEISENKEKQSAGSIETKKELRLSEINEDDKIIDVTRSLSTSKENIQADDLDEELIEERYMDDDANHELFYDPLKFKDYYQICTNIEVPDSPSLDKVNKTPFNSPIIHQPPPKPPRLRTSSRESSIPKDCDLANTLTRAEIVVHEMDDVSECGSEDVDTIGHQFQKSEDDKHIYVNQLSLAAELLKTQQSIPYDQEFKPLSEGEGSSNDAAYLQTCASTSHSNRDVYDKYYGSVIIPLQDVTINQPHKIKEVSDSGVQSEESADEDDISKRKGEKPTGRPIGYKVIENKAKPLSAMLKGKGDPLCLCCSVM